jgi:STE24 endopeptidase
MTLVFTITFVAFLLLMVSLQFWLSMRQIRHVSAHAHQVPDNFAGRITLAAHQRAAAYTVTRQKLGMLRAATSAGLLVVLTLLGGLQWIASQLQPIAGTGLTFQIAIVVAIALLLTVIEWPFDWYSQFRVEQQFGFNRMTPAMFVSDAAKALLLGALLGLPLVALVLWLMQTAGSLWWLYAWIAWLAFNLLILVLYPTLIAPLFNKFEPLSDPTLAQRIQALLDRTGFTSRGVFVMDGSRRSAHGNAYFTGLGRAKRIVFFDTLVERLLPQEIEAVLAHELGHFKLRHVTKRLLFSFGASLAFLALLGWLIEQPWFYQGLGVQPLDAAGTASHGLALVLFILVLPVFTFVLAPLGSLLSRKHEFEADAFAAHHSRADDLVAALVKLYEDNASTLTPDPLHSAFYDSHPPAAIRIARLRAAGLATTGSA